MQLYCDLVKYECHLLIILNGYVTLKTVVVLLGGSLGC